MIFLSFFRLDTAQVVFCFDYLRFRNPKSNHNADLKDDPQYIDDVKIPFFGFVSCDKHCQISADSATEKRKRQKHLFGYSHFAVDGIRLVGNVENKRYQTHYSENATEYYRPNHIIYTFSLPSRVVFPSTLYAYRRYVYRVQRRLRL